MFSQATMASMFMKATPKQLATALVQATEGKSGKELQSAVSEFVRILSQERLMHRWRDIARAVDRVWIERHGMANVTVATAYPLDKPLMQALEKAANGASVTTTVEPELLGGARIRIDDRLIDGSIAGHLERLRTTLSE